MAQVRYYFEPDGRFVVEEYNNAKPFCDFLPGIAGKTGVPVWAFYINRGQGLAGFGLGDKDGAIQEYVPADKAAWYAAWRGFRTFLKLKHYGDAVLYEPFRSGNEQRWRVRSRLEINASDIGIMECNDDLGIEVRVEYFTLPGAKIGGLYRKTRIVNHNRAPILLEVVDGLAAILPAGFNNFLAKNMGATIRAWMRVGLGAGVPFYRLGYLPDDVPELHPISIGHFHLGYTLANQEVQKLSPIYDPSTIFGLGADYQPVRFASADYRYSREQSTENYLPCAMGHLETELPAGGGLDLFGLYGYAANEDILRSFLPEVNATYYDERRHMNRMLIREITDQAFTSSSDPLFDRYLGQCYLDNVMRGGIPVNLAGKERPRVFWLYSRKHGDLERDYNDFRLSPTYYSQGNGNFRDVNQNRRHDVWFNPQVGDATLHYFWNLIQLDGYNPLVVKGITYAIGDLALAESLLQELMPDQDYLGLLALIDRPFTPGDAAAFLEQIRPAHPKNRCIIAALLEQAEALEDAEPIREGYWIDHWIYNLDLFDAFAGIYPDRLKQACFERRDYTFYDNSVVLTPFDERYKLIDGKVRLKDCVRIDAAKKCLIEGREHHPHQVRTGMGRGEVYHTNLLVKMLTLFLNKLASFDPYVTGMEMDAGKPGWCDALNGLPGILGSSVGEVFALQRLLGQMQNIIETASPGTTLALPVEIITFLSSMEEYLRRIPRTREERYGFWETTHRLRDVYLAATLYGLHGQEQELSLEKLSGLLTRGRLLIDQALSRAYLPETGLYHTYFSHQVLRWRDYVRTAEEGALEEKGGWPEDFTAQPLPPFLEGQVHALRGSSDAATARALYRAVRESPLYDGKLKMYKICADLSCAAEELGRIRIFPRGWLENESVFLHMEYKYLLEILASGLYEEFFSELPRLLVCYMDPKVYGRNPLENSSFITSSVYPQEDLHGNGFIARLSGSTAEMLHIRLLMSFGPHPFRLDARGELVLAFAPILKSSFFRSTENQAELVWDNGLRRSYPIPADAYAARFLGNTLVVYKNPKHRDTFGANAVQVSGHVLSLWNGDTHTVDGPVIKGESAHWVRDGLVERIDVSLD